MGYCPASGSPLVPVEGEKTNHEQYSNLGVKRARKEVWGKREKGQEKRGKGVSTRGGEKESAEYGRKRGGEGQEKMGNAPKAN